MNNTSVVVLTIVVGVVCLAGGAVLGFAAAVVVLGGAEFAEVLNEIDSYEQYYDISVLESEIRGEGVYIKYQNTGAKVADDLYFIAEFRDETGKLVDEVEVNVMQPIEPNQIEETILKAYDFSGELIQMDGLRAQADYSYGWVKTESAESTSQTDY